MRQFSWKVQRTLRLAAVRFVAMDGAQRAAAFAHNAFLALFPTMLLAVNAAAAVFGPALAGGDVVNYLGAYIPAGGGVRRNMLGVMDGIASTGSEAGGLLVLVLVWASSQFYVTIVRATNLAWGDTGGGWLKKPLKAFTLLGIMMVAVVAGVAVPLLGRMAESLPGFNFLFSWVYRLTVVFLPWLVLFFGLAMFYKLAPYRKTRLAEVWAPALLATLLLQAAQNLFVLYLRHYSRLDVIYGAMGGVIAMMMWVYLSGVIFIFCACLCAAQAEVLGAPADRAKRGAGAAPVS